LAAHWGAGPHTYQKVCVLVLKKRFHQGIDPVPAAHRKRFLQEEVRRGEGLGRIGKLCVGKCGGLPMVVFFRYVMVDFGGFVMHVI